MSEKSLQININSVDDAKAVIQHLNEIKVAYKAHNCTTIEFCIAEGVVTRAARILVGAIPWCTTYTKHVKPFDGNVPFELPHYVPPPSNPKERTKPPGASVPYTEIESRKEEPKPEKVNRYLRNIDTGKSAPPVQAQPSGAT